MENFIFYAALFQIMIDANLQYSMEWGFFNPGISQLKIGANPNMNITPLKWDVNWTYIKRSEDVYWTSYVRSIYVLCQGGTWTQILCV